LALSLPPRRVRAASRFLFRPAASWPALPLPRFSC